jgi:hypothetical protein
MLPLDALSQRYISPVNTWPWRGWRVCRGSCGLKEE